MKRLIFLGSLFLLIAFNSCNQNEPTSPESDNQKSGKLFLKIDKANAPESVVWVEAFLTREGFEPISGSMNLLSDSTADLLLENIQAGEWHLKVDAKDSAQVVLYSGETDVNVFAGFTTQVNLVLEPTGNGVGNIYIWVTWGLPSTNWNDYSGNPVFVSSGYYWNYSGVQQSKILIEDGVIKMYYTAQGSAYSGYIGYAYSSDGVNWSLNSANPILSPGTYGSWDETAVAGGTVIHDEDGYKLYYAGWDSPDGNWHIGLATSSDGVNWIKHSTPVLYASGGSEYQLGPSSIIKINGTYYLYYYGRNLPYLDIRLATSSDGINWTRSASNPVLIASETWEGIGVYYASVYQKNGQYEMIYMNQPGTGFGKATSTDGINWEKHADNPFFIKDDTYNHWANYKIAYPYYVKINNQERIYYSGFSLNEYPKIGFVSK